MSIGVEKAHPFFEPDEFTAINNRYFADFQKTGKAEIDLSGWIETLSQVDGLIPPSVPQLPLGRYYMDEGNALGEIRPKLHHLLELWEGVTFDPLRFTVCPSVGIASLLTMAVLRRRGITRIVFETPCYFAALLQAEWLGFEVVMLPTYARDGYKRNGEDEQSVPGLPTAWWLTQPRVCLGFDQAHREVENLIATRTPADYVVIDEALDQSFPSHLAGLSHVDNGARVVRLKCFGKPLGLNGYRLAFALHDPKLRAEMIDCLETFSGAVDAHSVAAACAAAADPQRFRTMLQVANQQVRSVRLAADKICVDGGVRINPLVNGYIGSATVDLSRLGEDCQIRRHRFLSACQRLGMPVIIGQSMHFAFDPPSEAVRLNFFSRREHIIRGVSALVEIASGSI